MGKIKIKLRKKVEEDVQKKVNKCGMWDVILIYYVVLKYFKLERNINK